jgi:uridine phosphorylase
MADPKKTSRRPRCSYRNTGATRNDNAVVKPVKSKRSLFSGSPVVLVGTSGDLDSMIRQVQSTSVRPQSLYNSRLYVEENDPSSAVFIGPIVGAPYAAMVIETLIVWGARQFIFLGWCGAVSPEVRIGDILIPTTALIDEGTSGHYSCDPPVAGVSYPASISLDRIHQQFFHEKLRFHSGTVWTTDAIFRETPEKIKHFRSQGALAVDMETSALFTVAGYRGAEIGAILVVSDELSTLNWVPGFKTEAFSSGRAHAYEVIRRLCLPIPTPRSFREPPS